MKKKFKIALFVLSLFLLFIVGLGVFLSFHFEKIIRKHLTTAVEESTHELYHLKYEKLNFNFFSGNLRIKKFEFIPDTLVLDSLKKIDSIPGTVYDVRADEIKVGFGVFWRMLQERDLNIRNVDLYVPQLIITKDSVDRPAHKRRDIMEVFKKLFAKLEVRRFRIHDGSFEQRHAYLKEPVLYSFKHCDLRIDRFEMDSTVNLQEKKFPHWENVQCSVKDFYYNLPGGEYKLHTWGATLNYKDSLLKIDSFALVPQYGKYEFAQKSSNFYDRFDVNSRNIVAAGIHFNEFLLKRELYVNSITIGDFSFLDFKNLHFPLRKKERKLFHLALHQIPFKVDIPKIEIKKGLVVFEAISLHHATSGNVRFENIYGTFTGLTNTPAHEEQYVTVDARCKVNGRGVMAMNIAFPVNIENENVTVTGSLGNMDLTALNTIIYPLTTAQIKSGHSDRLDFVIHAKNEVAHIDFKFLYHDLKVELPPMKHQKLVTGLVNNVFIMRDNPPKGGEPRSVKTYVYRDHYRDNFSYWGQAIFEGLKETEGLTRTLEVRLREMGAKIKDRREKREERQEQKVQAKK